MRGACAWTLLISAAAWGCSREDLVEKNLRRLGDPDPDVQTGAAFDLASLGERAIPRLIEALDDPEPLVRAGAIGTLSMMKAATGDLRNLVIARLDDPDDGVRSRAAVVIALDRGTAPPRLLDVLLELLKGQEEWKVRSAASALEARREEAIARLPDIIGIYRAARHKAPIAELFGRLGPAATTAVPALVDAARDPAACLEAVDALLKIDPRQRAGIPCLVERARRPGAESADLETDLLAKMGPESVPALLELLRSEREEFRSAAADALGSMGAGAKDALPALRKALEDPVGFVQTSAQDAVRAIEADAANDASEPVGPD